MVMQLTILFLICFLIKLIAGDKTTALTEPNTVILTETTCKRNV